MTSSNIPFLHRFIEFINSGDANIGSSVISDSALFHVPFDKEPLKGLEGYLRILTMLRAAFPDIQWTLRDTISEGDKVVARFDAEGTHRGSFLAVPPSGKTIKMGVVNIYRFQNGKIVEEMGQPDLFGLLIQIGGLTLPSA